MILERLGLGHLKTSVVNVESPGSSPKTTPRDDVYTQDWQGLVNSPITKNQSTRIGESSIARSPLNGMHETANNIQQCEIEETTHDDLSAVLDIDMSIFSLPVTTTSTDLKGKKREIDGVEKENNFSNPLTEHGLEIRRKKFG